jgi:SAM-dependent methyltransferase/uncharacterized protein YbaR (Trm112 family)
MDAMLDKLLVCPETLGELKRVEDGYLNEATGACYHIFEGIPVLRQGPLKLKESPWDEQDAQVDQFILKRFFDELQMPEFVLSALGAMIDDIVKTVSIRLGTTLDIDSATGRIVSALCESRLLGSYIVATDISPHILLGLRRKMNHQGLCTPAAVAVNPHRLPFRTGSFSTVVTLAGLNNLPNSRTVLGEVARVLKPDGLFVFGHMVLPNPESKGYLIAEERGFGDLADLSKLDTAMREYGLHLNSLKEYTHGKWPESSRNLIPASGDPFSLMLISARKEAE